jgi:hypothetical protein
MNKRAINVGDRWKRRVELHDDFDEIVVTGLVDHAGFRANEYSIQSTISGFGPTIQTSAQGIYDFCSLVKSGADPEEDWA